jgi:hypothetical protein
MSLFPLVSLIVVAAVLALIFGIGSLLLVVRAAMDAGGSGYATLGPVVVALIIAAIITIGAFVIDARGQKPES